METELGVVVDDGRSDASRSQATSFRRGAASSRMSQSVMSESVLERAVDSDDDSEVQYMSDSVGTEFVGVLDSEDEEL
jgi:hypothetical protein